MAGRCYLADVISRSAAQIRPITYVPLRTYRPDSRSVCVHEYPLHILCQHTYLIYLPITYLHIHFLLPHVQGDIATSVVANTHSVNIFYNQKKIRLVPA